MKTSTPMYVALLIAVALCVTTTAVPADAGPIYACAHKTAGHLRLVAAPGQCHHTEQALSWEDGSGVQVQINTLIARVEELERVIGIINTPPVVHAGPDYSLLLSGSVLLQGMASDDGLLDPLLLFWTQVSGPATAFFDDPSAAETRVRFAHVGDYVLRLTASDGLVSVFDETVVTVFPDNTPPVVDAGPDQVFSSMSCATTITGAVSDDGLPVALSIQWSGSFQDLGGCKLPPGFSSSISIADPNALSTTLTMSGGCSHSTLVGTVVLSVTDGFYAVSDELMITCLRP